MQQKLIFLEVEGNRSRDLKLLDSDRSLVRWNTKFNSLEFFKIKLGIFLDAIRILNLDACGVVGLLVLGAPRAVVPRWPGVAVCRFSCVVVE